MSRVLDTIDTPDQLASLNEASLRRLCDELRERIIATTGANGGHLASNLGVVELTVALLRAFKPEHDRIVWDTGHQCYAWKLLTGRREAFASLRRTDGLTGFIKPGESACDAFGVGHAGTALSAALGMAAVRDREKSDRHIVAVVGDAACGNGVSFEALNNIAETTGRFILVLNDNEMSIGGSVGALTRYFGRLLTNTQYNRWKGMIESVAARLRMSSLRHPYHRMEEALKSLVLENAFFEELGLRYIGPIDGHHLGQLEKAFALAREADRPIVLHVATRKGKGYAPAEADPEFWHSAGRFDPPTGAPAGGGAAPRSYSEVFGRGLCRLAQRDPRVMGITAAMRAGTGMGAFSERFPDRFFDVGICESHALTFAAGMASAGYRPVVALYSTFLQRAVDAVFHDICLQGLPVLLCLDRAGIVGADGPTHHGLFDIALLRASPGLVMMQPRDEIQFERMLDTALSLEGPCVIRYPRGGCPASVHSAAKDVSTPLTLGEAEAIRPPPGGGAPRVWFWALGDMLETALEAAARLERDFGLPCGVTDPRFIKPLDRAKLSEQAREAEWIVTLENGSLLNGFGGAVLEALSDAGLRTPVLRFGWPDGFVPHGAAPDLIRRYGLDAEGVVRRVRDVVDSAGDSRPEAKA